jgi:hypothetical protein
MKKAIFKARLFQLKAEMTRLKYKVDLMDRFNAIEPHRFSIHDYQSVMDEMENLGRGLDNLISQAFGSGSPAPRPSDHLLWEAFLVGEKIGTNPPSLKRDEAFETWLTTLPADTLKADRELVRAKIRTIAKGIALASEDMRLDSGLLDCVKRLAGLEVGNG